MLEVAVTSSSHYDWLEGRNTFCQAWQWPTDALVSYFLLPLVARFFFKKILFIYFNWRLITLQYCSGFCHTLTWISHECTCVPYPEPPSPSLPILSLRVVPVHWLWVPCFIHQTWTGDLFTYGNIHVSVLFSQIIPPSPSPRVQKFFISVSLLLSRT